MAAVNAANTEVKVVPVVVTPSVVRMITELMAKRREFNRSKLIRDVLIEAADRELAADWRDTTGLTEESAA